MVDSVDSMQGSEKDIIIFAATRSNNDRKIGFLEQQNRLNVATSRARRLKIIIWDMSTLAVNPFFFHRWLLSASRIGKIQYFCSYTKQAKIAYSMG